MISAAQPATMPMPSPRVADEALDLVFIEGFTGHTVIGIHPNELGITQPVVIDVCAGPTCSCRATALRS